MAGTEKRHSTEQRNTDTISVAATTDSPYEWRGERAHVMRNAAQRIVLIILAATLTILQPPTARAAGVTEELWGLVSDPFGVRRASSTLADSAERTLAQLDALIANADTRTKARLEQTRDIMRDVLQQALTGAQATVDLASSRMQELEQRVNLDAINLLYRAQCSVQDTLVNGRRAFADVLGDIRRADPGIKVFGIRIINLSTNEVEVSDPDKAYWNLRDARIAELRKSLTAKSRAYEILSVYANLQRMARLTLCSYLDQPSFGQIMVREINENERHMSPWATVVTLQR